MAAQDIRKICVVGAGNMGHQIAICGALGGFDVSCTDIDPAVLEKAQAFADTWLASRVEKGKMTDAEATAVRARLTYDRGLGSAAADADLVIETAPEKLELKRALFAELDLRCPDRAILATNSSNIVSSRLADATTRPHKVVNMHFFNPALVMRLVEVARGPAVSDDTVETVMQVCRSMGKTPILIKKEVYGLIVNRIFRAIVDEALFLYDTDIATYEDIDAAVVHGLGYPMGPFQLLDLVGLDLYYLSRIELYKETGASEDKPSPALIERYARGEFGRKAGKGFYAYDQDRITGD